MKTLDSLSWPALAAIAGLLFGVGDFLVVKTEKKASALSVFAAYSVAIGAASAMILMNQPKETQNITANVGWGMIMIIAALHFVAYLTHFMSIQRASNPGYANAIVMFHVVVLALLSWKYLAKPLTPKGVLGIALMFIGASIVVRM